MIASLVIMVLAGMACGLLLYTHRLATALASERQKNIASLKAYHAFNPNLTINDFFYGLDEAQDGIALMDDQGNIQYANKALWRIYAIGEERRGDFLGRHWSHLHSRHGRQQIEDNVLPILEEKGEWFGETDVKIQDGSLIRAELSIKRAPDGTYAGVIRDITQRHKQSQERENLLIQLHQTQKAEAIGRVLRGLVHDFNNTLSAIGGYSELLLEDLEPESDHYEFAERIFRSCNQTKRILSQARMLLPERAAKDQYSDIVKFLTNIRYDEAFEKRQNYTIDTVSDLEAAQIILNEKQTRNLVVHLIENALEACAASKARARLELSFFNGDLTGHAFEANAPVPKIEKLPEGRSKISYGILDPQQEYVSLTVSDEGCGVPANAIDHIFDPFFTTKNAETSTGMGMSVVQSLIKSNQGYIVIDTHEGKGTSVTVLLRAVPGSVRKRGSFSEAQKGSVILVDDQPMVREVHKILLQKYGFRVFDFVSPYEALEFMQENAGEFQCVFTDVTMRELSGVEFSKTLFAKFPDLPVFLLTGHDDIEENLPANIRHVLRKPLEISALSKAFESVH